MSEGLISASRPTNEGLELVANALRCEPTVPAILAEIDGMKEEIVGLRLRVEGKGKPDA